VVKLRMLLIRNLFRNPYFELHSLRNDHKSRLFNILAKSIRISGGENREFVYLSKILSKIDGYPKYFVDTAASNGIDQSVTYPLLLSGWSGLGVEMDKEKFTQLSFLWEDFNNVSLSKSKVTPENATALFDAMEVPRNFGFWNMDIDSFDLQVVCAVLESGYKPTVISIEINEKVPPGVYFEVEYDKDHTWQGDHFYGCSLESANHRIGLLGYSLVGLELNNAFFVSNEATAGRLPSQSVQLSYCKGYLEHPLKAELFPYNSEFDYLCELEPQNAAEELVEIFSKYAGKFKIGIRDTNAV